jgi:hypothetical protein
LHATVRPLAGRIGLLQNAPEVHPVYAWILAAADLLQQVNPPDDLVERPYSEPGKDLANFLGDVHEEVDDLFGSARELLTQILSLRRDAGWARV